MSGDKTGADDFLKTGERLEDLERADPPAPHCTDVGNGERFVRLHGAEARYVYSLRAWLEWVDTHWRRDAGDGALRRAKLTTRSIYAEAAAEMNPRRRVELAAWA